MRFTWGFNEIKILKLFVYFFSNRIDFYKYQIALMFKFWKFLLYELLKSLNQVPPLRMNVSSYATTFPMKLNIVHIEMRKF